MQSARDNANRILRAFPDYGKSPPEYIASLVQVIASYPVDIQDKLTDLRRGIAGKCQFLPTVAAVVEMADGFVKDDLAERAFAEKYAQRREVLPDLPKGAFRPFPQLWAAFADDPDILKHKTFEAYADATKALVTQGREAAQHILLTAISPKAAA